MKNYLEPDYPEYEEMNPMIDQTLIRSLVDLRDKTLQKARIGMTNRIKAVERGSDEMSPEQVEILKIWTARFEELEKDVENQIKELAKDSYIIQQMTAVKGVGLVLAAKVSSMIDIRRADTVSALWRYAGYAVMDGKRERPVKGEKLHYNVRLKSACYLIGSSFLRSNSPYRRVYDSARDYYQANRPEWTKAHQHQAAMRKMIKTWLSHLWLVWRTAEGLPTRSLYVNDYLGHDHYYAPDEFGWMVYDPESLEISHC